MGCEHKYYKPEEAAAILKMKPENIWRAIQNESSNVILPAVIFMEPVSMKEHVNHSGQEYHEETGKTLIVNKPIFEIDRDLSGLFDIFGAFDDGRWAESNGDYLDITFTSVKPPKLLGPCYLRRNGKQYSVPERKLIPKADLVISKDSIEHFAKAIGLTPAWPLEQKESTLVAQALKKQQTSSIDSKINDICLTIKNKAVTHMKGSGTERVINHVRFIDEAGISQGKDRERALMLVKKYIADRDGDLGFHGFKYTNKPIAKDRPYFLTEEEGRKAED